MGLTRPTVAQLNTIVTEISDPISVLNKGSTQANVDVGLLFNRDGGVSSNVALYWNETSKSLVSAYTNSTGGVNANIAVTSYANLTVGNIIGVSANVSGNVTANYFFGNGSQLSGIITSVTKIINGTSNVTAYENSNVAVSVAGVGNTVVFSSSNVFLTGSIIPTANITYDLGSTTQRFRSAYFSGSTIYIGNTAISESTVAAISTFPTGDYGDIATSSTDAFGVQNGASFDLGASGVPTVIDLEVLP